MPWDIDKGIGGYFDSAFRRGIAKVIILNYLAKHKSHPYAILKGLKKVPSPAIARLSKSDIYNIISSLENEGYITSRVLLSGAKAKKIYTVTAKGGKVAHNSKRILLRHILAMKNLVKEEFNE